MAKATCSVGKRSPGVALARSVAAPLLRFALGAVFLYAGILKAAGPQRFALDIESYHLVSPAIGGLLAHYLPYLEIICALGFCLRVLAPGATLLAGGLTSMFIVALASAWARRLEIRCGCFGDEAASGAGHGADYLWWLGRDCALLAGCVVLWMLFLAENKSLAIFCPATEQNRDRGSAASS